MPDELRSEWADDELKSILGFLQPMYVITGDTIEVESIEHVKISWDIKTAMVLIGVRLDGWPVEIIDGEYHSAQYDSISRTEEDE
jgi:hypothetical protein